MAYTVFHDRKPAHNSTRETDQNKQTPFTFCSRCKDWFKLTEGAKVEREWKLRKEV